MHDIKKIVDEETFEIICLLKRTKELDRDTFQETKGFLKGIIISKELKEEKLEN